MTVRKLNFGCGLERDKTRATKFIKDIDLSGCVTADLSGADYNFDFNKFPYPFPDNYFDEIYALSVIDHLDDFVKVMKELHRISKPNAILKIMGPFYNCQTSYFPLHKQHLTYGHFWGLTEEQDFETPETKKKCVFKYEIIKFVSIPTSLGKFIPDIKLWKNKHIGLRYAMAMVLGEIVRTLYVELRVIKKDKSS